MYNKDYPFKNRIASFVSFKDEKANNAIYF